MNNIMIKNTIYNLDKYDQITFFDGTLRLWEAGSGGNAVIISGPEAAAAWQWLQKTCMWTMPEPEPENCHRLDNYWVEQSL